MLEDIFQSSAAETLSLKTTVLIVLSSLALGLVISAVYILTHRKEGYNAGFTITLIMLPAIISMIILLVGSSVARAFSLAGAFSLIRFRSAPGDAKDIAYVFFSVAVGLACGMGFIAYAALFAIMLCAVMALLQAVRFGTRGSAPMRLRITIPENMDYQGVFDETLSRFTSSYKLVRVRTAEFGSLFELSYDVYVKDMSRSKKLMDALRTKNGNLNVTLSLREQNEVTL